MRRRGLYRILRMVILCADATCSDELNAGLDLFVLNAESMDDEAKSIDSEETITDFRVPLSH